MAIVVTAGAADAVAYGSAVDATSYFSARGITTWTGTEAVMEAALIRGTDYLERRYAGKWIGTKATQAQALSWPRSWVEDLDGYAIRADEVPAKIVSSNFEAALLILTGTDLEPLIEKGGAIKRKRTKAGPVETETEYAGSTNVYDTISRINGLLTGLVLGGTATRILRS